MLARWQEKFKLQFRKLKKNLKARWAAKPNFGSARLVLFALGAFMLFALIYLAQSSNAALLARDLRVKQLKIQEVERENAQLRYEIAALASPSAIEQRARKLGLGPAKRVVYADMPWIEPSANELMPAFLPQVWGSANAETFDVTNSTVVDQLLSMLGLANIDNRANAVSAFQRKVRY